MSYLSGRSRHVALPALHLPCCSCTVASVVLHLSRRTRYVARGVSYPSCHARHVISVISRPSCCPRFDAPVMPRPSFSTRNVWSVTLRPFCQSPRKRGSLGTPSSVGAAYYQVLYAPRITAQYKNPSRKGRGDWRDCSNSLRSSPPSHRRP